MILKFRNIPFKSIPSILHSQVYFPFSDNKRPFDREIRSSPISRKPSSFWDIFPKTPKAAQTREQPVPIKEETIEPTFQSAAPIIKEGRPVDPKVSIPGTPLEQQPPKIEKEIKPEFDPVPLDFTPLSPSKMSSTILSEIHAQGVKPNTQANVNLTNGVNQTSNVNSVVMSNIGLNRYLTRIYLTSGAALMLTLASSYACIAFPGIQAYSELLLMGGGAISFLSFNRAQSIRPKFYQQKVKEDTIYRTSNDPMRLGMFGIGCIAMGLSASPLFLSIQEVSTAILPMTMGVTAAIFGGASLMGLILPRTMMLGYGGALGGSFLGILGLNATGVLAAKYLGITIFASTLTTAEAYFGIGMFSLMIIYDTHQAIKRYERGDADHLGMSIQILLDIWNLIIMIAKEIAKAKMKQEKSNSENNKKD